MNYNPSATRVLVFGDSLSWGYIPGSKHQRYPVDVRWPGKLQMLLGNDYEIIEENLNSRGIENGDPRAGKEGRRALDYIEACLDSHDPLDVVIVLLGTNEMKRENNLSAANISESMEKLLQIILNRPSQCRAVTPAIILVSPPLIREETDYCQAGNKYVGGTKKSQELVTDYQKLAEKLGIRFVSLASIRTGIDGIHIDDSAHKIVAELLEKTLLTL